MSASVAADWAATARYRTLNISRAAAASFSLVITWFQAWSRFAAGRGDSSKTAAVPAIEAIHQPASRSGIIAAVPPEEAGSTNARSAPILPAAAFGSSAPAKRTTKVTGTATREARRTEEDTRVPITTRTVPVSARPRRGRRRCSPVTCRPAASTPRPRSRRRSGRRSAPITAWVAALGKWPPHTASTPRRPPAGCAGPGPSSRLCRRRPARPGRHHDRRAAGPGTVPPSTINLS